MLWRELLGLCRASRRHSATTYQRIWRISCVVAEQPRDRVRRAERPLLRRSDPRAARRQRPTRAVRLAAVLRLLERELVSVAVPRGRASAVTSESGPGIETAGPLVADSALDDERPASVGTPRVK